MLLVFGFTGLIGFSLGPTMNHYLSLPHGSEIVGTARVFLAHLRTHTRNQGHFFEKNMMLDIAWCRRYVTIKKTWPVFDRRLTGHSTTPQRNSRGNSTKRSTNGNLHHRRIFFCSLAVKFAFSRGAGETKIQVTNKKFSRIPLANY
ncbi:hypothetical protein ACFS07_17020 [Undibacterium arcticum]